MGKLHFQSLPGRRKNKRPDRESRSGLKFSALADYIMSPMPPMPPMPPPPIGAPDSFLGFSAMRVFGGEHEARNRCCVLESATGDLSWVDDARSDQVFVLLGERVEAETKADGLFKTLSTTMEPSKPALPAIWRRGSSRARRMIRTPASCSALRSLRPSRAFEARRRAVPPPGTMPSSTLRGWHSRRLRRGLSFPSFQLRSQRRR